MSDDGVTMKRLTVTLLDIDGVHLGSVDGWPDWGLTRADAEDLIMCVQAFLSATKPKRKRKR